MAENGNVNIHIENGIGTVSFFHPKKNSLPGALLKKITESIEKVGKDDAVRVVILKSEGKGPFCAGASFDELMAIDSFGRGKEFFMGFARLILAMKKCPKFIIGRIHGKAVGGGVGVASAVDYALATTDASVKLSELALGIGPFVVGPAVERKIGTGAFTTMSIDADWRSAVWAAHNGLYMEVCDSIATLDTAVIDIAQNLANRSPEAMQKLKAAFWEGTEHWDQLLESRAEMSGKLVLSDFTANAISAFKRR